MLDSLVVAETGRTLAIPGSELKCSIARRHYTRIAHSIAPYAPQRNLLKPAQTNASRNTVCLLAFRPIAGFGADARRTLLAAFFWEG